MNANEGLTKRQPSAASEANLHQEPEAQDGPMGSSGTQVRKPESGTPLQHIGNMDDSLNTIALPPVLSAAGSESGAYRMITGSL